MCSSLLVAGEDQSIFSYTESPLMKRRRDISIVKHAHDGRLVFYCWMYQHEFGTHIHSLRSTAQEPGQCIFFKNLPSSLNNLKTLNKTMFLPFRKIAFTHTQYFSAVQGNLKKTHSHRPSFIYTITFL